MRRGDVSVNFIGTIRLVCRLCGKKEHLFAEELTRKSKEYFHVKFHMNSRLSFTLNKSD